jgi:Tol biopolymer transport system component
MDRDGSDRRLVFPKDQELGLKFPETAWSPEGDQIVAVYQENLYLIQIPSGELHQLTASGGVTTIEWQPGRREDGEQIAGSPTSERPVSPQDRLEGGQGRSRQD